MFVQLLNILNIYISMKCPSWRKFIHHHHVYLPLLTPWPLLSLVALCRSARASVSHTTTGCLLACLTSLSGAWRRWRPPVLKMSPVMSRMKAGAMLAPHLQSWPSTQLKLPTFVLKQSFVS